MAKDNPLHTSTDEKHWHQFFPVNDKYVADLKTDGNAGLQQRMMRELQYAGALPSDIKANGTEYVAVPGDRVGALRDAGFKIGQETDLAPGDKDTFVAALAALEARNQEKDKDSFIR